MSSPDMNVDGYAAATIASPTGRKFAIWGWNPTFGNPFLSIGGNRRDFGSTGEVWDLVVASHPINAKRVDSDSVFKEAYLQYEVRIG